jgi:anthranilate phosphoribosyltransferase
MHSATATYPAAATTTMRAIIQRIATGPEHSKDLSQQEARHGLRLILEKQVHPVQAAVFLIALRMKRETDEENKGMLEALQEVTRTTTAAVDEVVDVAEPYDGYRRALPVSPFLPALLAACGVPTVVHGVETLGPKYGLTLHQVLQAAGQRVDLVPEAAAARLAAPHIGWAYVDQAAFCPPLHALTELRRLIVKRPALSTLETVIGPVRGRQKTHLLTGYVHKPYPRIYAMLARQAGFASALIVRGTEGGILPSLRQPAPCFAYHDGGAEHALEVQPLAFGITQATRAVPLPGALHQDSHPEDDLPPAADIAAMARATATAGLEALQGQAGPMRDGLIYAAALVLLHLQRYDSPSAAAAAARAAVDTGRAWRHFQAAYPPPTGRA